MCREGKTKPMEVPFVGGDDVTGYPGTHKTEGGSRIVLSADGAPKYH